MKFYKKRKTKRVLKNKRKKTMRSWGGFIDLNHLNPFTSSTTQNNSVLPKNWYEYKGPDSQVYYWNSITNRFQREFPDASIAESENLGYKVLMENKSQAIPVTNCQCSQGIGVNKQDFPIKIDNQGNIYMENGKDLFKKTSIECNPMDCQIDKMVISDTDRGCWLDSIVSTRIKELQNNTGAKSNELIIVHDTDIKMGHRKCNEIKEELKTQLEKIMPNKSCTAFTNINTIHIKEHDLKPAHLSVLPLVFRLFSNIQVISIEMDPGVVLDEEKIKCLQDKYKLNIQFDNKTKILVATR